MMKSAFTPSFDDATPEMNSRQAFDDFAAGRLKARRQQPHRRFYFSRLTLAPVLGVYFDACHAPPGH